MTKQNESNWIFPRDVRGWLSLAEGELLRDLSANKVVLELGSFCGRSTISMAQYAEKVYAVDWFQGDRRASWDYLLPEYASNLQKYNVIGKVVTLACNSVLAKNLLPHDFFDVVFIDMSHDKKSVLKDIELALPRLKKEATLAFHDSNETGVYQAIQEVFPGISYNTVDSIAWFEIHK